MKKIALTLILVLALCSCASKRNAGPSKEPAAVEAEKNYIGHSPEECARIQVQCIPGFERFDDETGCGCRKKETQ